MFIPALPLDKDTAIKFIKEESERQKMIDSGITYAKLYLKYLKKNE